MTAPDLQTAVSAYEAAASAMRDRLGVPPPLPVDAGAPTAEEAAATWEWTQRLDAAIHDLLRPAYAIGGTVRGARRAAARDNPTARDPTP